MKTNKKQLLLAVIASLSLLLPTLAAAAGDKGAPKGAAPKGTSLKTETEKLSYAFGRNIGKSLLQQVVQQAEIEIALGALILGLNDSLQGKMPQLPEEEMALLFQEFKQKTDAKQALKMKTDSEKNQKEGAAFMEANKKKEGVKVTASGLQYKVVKKGEGPTPKETDIVKVHYRGTLLDGKEFDNSYKSGQPAVFSLERTIPGFREALQLMTVGSKYQLVIPSALAYGEQGGPSPNATLLFDVELLGIESAESKATEPKK